MLLVQEKSVQLREKITFPRAASPVLGPEAWGTESSIPALVTFLFAVTEYLIKTISSRRCLFDSKFKGYSPSYWGKIWQLRAWFIATEAWTTVNQKVEYSGRK